MAECKGCGSFVSDDYARVFGDNDDTVRDCRHCPTSRGRDTGEEEDEDDGDVLLSEVRGSDAHLTGRGRSTGRSAGADGDDEPGPQAGDGLGFDISSIRSVLTNGRG